MAMAHSKCSLYGNGAYQVLPPWKWHILITLFHGNGAYQELFGNGAYLFPIEESYISAEEFCRAARQDASVVLKGEVGVLQQLVGFNSKSTCPFLHFHTMSPIVVCSIEVYTELIDGIG
eukprot:1158476-Pelagomonas_calceolata.AAC.1